MKDFFLRLIRWSLTLLGGALLGAGLVLHAQIAVARHMRHEVQGTFFLWRGIGKLTFWFQDEVTKVALALDEVPRTVLVDADRAAWTLMVLGLLVAMAGHFVVSRRAEGRRKPSKA